MTILAPVRTPSGLTPLGECFERLCSDRGSDRALDGLLFKAFEEAPGDVWSDEFGDDVWHRRDPADSAAWDPPAPYTSRTEAAFGILTLTDADVFELTFRNGSWETRLNEAAARDTFYARASDPARAIAAIETLRRDHAAARKSQL